MKKELIVKRFDNLYELVKFVNENKIEKDDVLSVIPFGPYNSIYNLLYWGIDK